MNKLTVRKRIFLLWIYLHFGILVLSYSAITIFNGFGSYEVDRVWPFVEYASYKNKFVATKMITADISEGYTSNEKEIINFYGVFTDYDISDFLLYCFLGLTVFYFTVPKNIPDEMLTT